MLLKIVPFFLVRIVIKTWFGCVTTTVAPDPHATSVVGRVPPQAVRHPGDSCRPP